MKNFLITVVIYFLAFSAYGGCNQDKGTVSGNQFVINNQLDQTITVSQFVSGSLTPKVSSKIASNSMLRSSDSKIIRICAYTTTQVSSRVSQQSRLACCDSSEGFSGSTINFMDTNSFVTYKGQAKDGGGSTSSNTQITGKALGVLMGY